MNKSKPKQNVKMGVYYASSDYAGFWRRVIAWAIDLALILCLVAVYGAIFYFFSDWSELEAGILFWGSLLSAYLYLAVVKNTESSTLGFRLLGIRIVDLQGKRPTWAKMTSRFLLLAIGPFELVTDMIWLAGEETKQTLRDKFVGTYVIKKTAEPVGEAQIVGTRLCVLGANLLFSEVAIPNKATMMTADN